MPQPLVLPWLHFEHEPLRWLGLVRSIGEPRLNGSITLQIEWQPSQDSLLPLTGTLPSTDTHWRIVSWTANSGGLLHINDLYQLRLAYPDATRIAFASPETREERLQLLEAGAHWVISDALALCRWFSKLTEPEYLHRHHLRRSS